LAAHAERRLVGAEAAQLDAHLADCSTCYETFAETVQFLLAEEPAEEPVPDPARVLPFHRRPAFQIAAGLAAAAGLVLAVRYFSLARSPRPSSPLAELAEAMGTTRFVEPRVTGGFEHGRLVILRSGDTTQGLDAHTPSVIAAVAHIRERAQGDTSPEALGALAVTYLVSGDPAAAVKALESATAQDPKNAKLQSDLAAAYLVRASRLDEPSDIPKALEAAEKSIEQKGAPVEAWFNRALALEQLHLVDAARKAWDDYLQRDPTSPWAAEAKKRRDELPPAQQSTLEEDRARAKAALAEGKAAIDSLADESPQVLRDYFDNVLLYAWSDAYLANDPNAASLKANAELIGDALLRTTGDAMPRDAALAVPAPPSGQSRDPPRTQALGYKALQSAERMYDAGQANCPPSRKAQRLLQSGDSPYRAIAQYRAVVGCFYFSLQFEAGIAELSRIELNAEQHHYSQLLGRVRQLQGLFLLHKGEFSSGIDRYRQACASFRDAKDVQSEAKCLVMIAEGLRYAGGRRGAWREHLAGLALLDRVWDAPRRHGILAEVAISCRDENLLRTALAVQNALVETDLRWSNPMAIGDALLGRSLILHTLGSDDAADADLLEARRFIRQITDPAVARRIEAFVDAADGEVLVAREPERAAACLKRAIEYFEQSSPLHVPALRLLQARAMFGRGLDDAAEAELAAGIEMLESQRQSFRQTELQAGFFDRASPLFDDMVGFQVDKRRDPRRALSFVERGRARQLVDALSSRRVSRAAATGPDAAAGLAPLEPEALQRQLPDGAALVYYASLPHRLLSWVVTRQDIQFVDQSLPADELRSRVAAYYTAIERRAPLEVVREPAARLFDDLVRPLTPFLRSQQVVVVLTDGVLQSVSFASLWDRRSGHYFAEDYLLASAPSGTVFVRASQAPALSSPRAETRLLAVGNPRLDRDQLKGLPSLPGAETEAAEVAALYANAELLTGRGATKTAFLSAARKSDIVHFAGHATSGDGLGAAQLLLASDPFAGANGVLLTSEVEPRDFQRTRVVVLAGCRTASGDVSRLEGAMSFARPFIAAGVPSVIASLWDVDDSVSRRFFVAFHRALLASGDPAEALRQTQIRFLHNADSTLSHPASWAGFAYVGGVHPGASSQPSQSVAERRPL
jgi:CHAT domain-containing protein/tetratricopeptide (TPR) repeat protein